MPHRELPPPRQASAGVPMMVKLRRSDPLSNLMSSSVSVLQKKKASFTHEQDLTASKSPPPISTPNRPMRLILRKRSENEAKNGIKPRTKAFKW
ncbi:hypothetical protein COLO4_32926 [Corchorus olitorius]|uniref:Uncharacterized protein n=1 Tax=Corchorus olitorius TaxID=93759 RepID=A0A1R3GXB9_9ROSI|nr:hypothetical protein COLO4_32926 [Corchorus olitorius]